MKKYLSFFRIRFTTALQYRAAAWAGVSTQFVWGFMKILMFQAFYRSDPAAFPMEFSQLCSYIWLQQAFLALFAFWFFDNDVFEIITGGGIAYELLRPMNLYNMWFTKNMASRSGKALLRCVPILFICTWLPEPYRFGLPADPVAFFMFLISMALGLTLVVSTCMIIYIITMRMLNYRGVKMLVTSLVELLSGSVVPLPFFPDGFRQVAELLPFASMNNLPFRIYIGDISGGQMVFFVAVQIFWVVFFQLWGRLWMRRSLRNVVVQGG